jgi:tRNA 2-thiocytidine biosynthesis protein TtcA
MPPKYTTDDGRFEVIRPLIQCEESKLIALAEEQAFPILPCNLCGSQDGLKRDRMTELLATLEKEKPDVKSVMMSALANISPTHLFDRDLMRAWAERDPSIPAKASLKAGSPPPASSETNTRAQELTTQDSGKTRLRVISS